MGEAERYAEQLAHVRFIADEDQWPVPNDIIKALQAVLQHYDAYAAVVEAAQEVALYDDFGCELEPGVTLTAPANPQSMNEARMRLYEALRAIDEQ